MHNTIVTTTLLASISILSQTAQGAYVIADDYSGEAFFRSFDFFTDADPTNGHVKFQSMESANASGLAGFMDGGNATRAIYLGVDTTKEAAEGRDSVRVQSQKTYQHALVIADIVHMPGSVCGTWPAFWMVGSNWPDDGEIDIVEGVNDQTSNQMTLHTNSGPKITKATKQDTFTGQVLTQDCDVNAPDQSKNAGCAIADDSGLTFGADFNANGGGVYATEWTSQAIKIWFFPRGTFPSDIASSSPSPSKNWGPPTSVFTGASFNMDDHFRNLRLVFDTTFCGDWAGDTWNQTSCGQLAPTCEEYVSKNPGAFVEAYWAVNTLQVFQDDGRGYAVGTDVALVPVGPGNQTDTQTNVNVNLNGDTGVDTDSNDLLAGSTPRVKAVSQIQGNTGTGTFIKNAALIHPAIADNQVDVDTTGNTGLDVAGWGPREGGGGSVLSRWR